MFSQIRLDKIGLRKPIMIQRLFYETDQLPHTNVERQVTLLTLCNFNRFFSKKKNTRHVLTNKSVYICEELFGAISKNAKPYPPFPLQLLRLVKWSFL